MAQNMVEIGESRMRPRKEHVYCSLECSLNVSWVKLVYTVLKYSKSVWVFCTFVLSVIEEILAS